MTVLTVDDAATMRKLIAYTLSACGYKVLEAADGPGALALLQRTAADLIISDVNMPGMSGIDLTREIRKLPRFAATPILIVTTESESGIKAKAKAAGATGWIVKPFDPARLEEIVKRVLGN